MNKIESSAIGQLARAMCRFLSKMETIHYVSNRAHTQRRRPSPLVATMTARGHRRYTNHGKSVPGFAMEPFNFLAFFRCNSASVFPLSQMLYICVSLLFYSIVRPFLFIFFLFSRRVQFYVRRRCFCCRRVTTETPAAATTTKTQNTMRNET